MRRFTETLPAARGSSIHSLALSDDGRFLAIASADPGRPLWFRRLDQTTVETLAGTEQGEFPFFSPDGEWVAFFTGFENALKKMPTSGGGQVVTLADGLRRNWGGSWGPDGRIVFHSQSGGEGLSRVSALGGPTEVLTKPDAAAGENSHRWPQVLPGGDGIVFTVWKGSADASQIAYLSLRTGEKRDLLPGTFARYLPTGHLVYFAESRMMAAPFDAERGTVTGPPVPVQSVESAGPWGYRTVATTPDGLQVQALRPPSRLLWVGSDGAESEISLPRGSYRTPDRVARRHAHRAGAGGGRAQRRHLDLRSRRRQPDADHHPRREHVAGVDAGRRVAAVLVRARRHPHRLPQALGRHR